MTIIHRACGSTEIGGHQPFFKKMMCFHNAKLKLIISTIWVIKNIIL